jgi:hypothetical protein
MFTRIRISQLTSSSPYFFEIDPIQVKHVMWFILNTGDHMTLMFTWIRISQLTSWHVWSTWYRFQEIRTTGKLLTDSNACKHQSHVIVCIQNKSHDNKSCHSFKCYFCQLILKWNLHIGHYTYKDVQNFRNTLLDVKAEAWDMKSTQMTLANFDYLV